MIAAADLRRWAAMFPTAFRIGLREAIAYRAELVVWMLSYTMPLIMMALWTAVASDAPISGYGQPEFVGYFLLTLLVRMLVASWVVWELTFDIRQGTLSMWMLRPIPPLLAYAADNLGALPVRLLMGLPIVGIGFFVLWPLPLSTELVHWLLVPVVLFGAWLITFSVQAIVGMLAFKWESSLSLYDAWMGIYTLASGYIMPLALLPNWAQRIMDALPFRYMLSFPVELMQGGLSQSRALELLGVQWCWALGLGALALMCWRRWAPHFGAFGG